MSDQSKVYPKELTDEEIDRLSGQTALSDEQIQAMLDQTAAPQEITPTTSAPGRFMTGMGTELVNMLNPVNLVKSVGALGGAALQGGMAGLGNVVSQGLGAQVEDIYQQGKSGDVAGAMGRVGANALPFGMSKALSLMRMKVPSYATPAQEAAVGQAVKRGVGLDIGEITQNPVAQGMKAQVSRLPFAAASIARKKLTTAQQMDAALSEIAAESGPFRVVNPEMAGSSLTKALKSTVESAKAEVSGAAKTLEEMAANNVKEVQTGTKTITVAPDISAVMSGQPALPKTIKVPVMEQLEAPVKLTGYAERARELLTEFDSTISQVARDNSPAYAALKQVASRESEFVPLMDALHELSSLKSGSRMSGWLRNKSQGKFSQLVGEMQKAVEETLDEMGPDAKDAFRTYNEQTVVKHAAAKLGESAEKMGPARFFDYLTSPNDYNVQTLTDYLGKYPDAQKTIAGAWMNRTVDQISNKGILSWRGAKTRWERLGQKTKDLLWDKQTQQDLSELFDLAQVVQSNPNPSGTAIVSALGNLGAMLLRNPLQATGYILGSREIAKILSSTEGASLLKEGLQLPMTHGNAPTITTGLLVASGLSKAKTTAERTQ